MMHNRLRIFYNFSFDWTGWNVYNGWLDFSVLIGEANEKQTTQVHFKSIFKFKHSYGNTQKFSRTYGY